MSHQALSPPSDSIPVQTFRHKRLVRISTSFHPVAYLTLSRRQSLIARLVSRAWSWTLYDGRRLQMARTSTAPTTAGITAQRIPKEHTHGCWEALSRRQLMVHTIASTSAMSLQL